VRRILGLFAHPDDEIFCAGGTIAHHVGNGAEARIVSFTKGEAGRISHVDFATRSTLGEVRERELSEAASRLGVRDTRCLDFADGTLDRVDRGELIDAAVAEIVDFAPDTVISFDHTGAYGHPDHITMSQVSIAACKQAGVAAPERLLHATFPQHDQLLLSLIVDWLTQSPDRFRGSPAFTNALLMFADSSSMLGFASDRLGIDWFPAGSFIIEQGEPADKLYLLLSGAVEVRREVDGALSTVAEIGKGEFIGEIGLATGERRNAHCIASTDCSCFVLSRGTDSGWKPRGAGADLAVATDSDRACEVFADLTYDVRHLVDAKVEALSRHQTQYPIQPDLFPRSMLEELLGTETFTEAWPQNRKHSP